MHIAFVTLAIYVSTKALALPQSVRGRDEGVPSSPWQTAWTDPGWLHLNPLRSSWKNQATTTPYRAPSQDSDLSHPTPPSPPRHTSDVGPLSSQTRSRDRATTSGQPIRTSPEDLDLALSTSFTRHSGEAGVIPLRNTGQDLGLSDPLPSYDNRRWDRATSSPPSRGSPPSQAFDTDPASPLHEGGSGRVASRKPPPISRDSQPEDPAEEDEDQLPNWKKRPFDPDGETELSSDADSEPPPTRKRRRTRRV